MRRFMIFCAALTMAMATCGLDMLTGDTNCERVIRSDRWFLIYRQGGTITVNTAGTVDILLVGGGGGGGQNYVSGSNIYGGGGGGGGGVVYKTSFAVTPGTYPVTVGAGGGIGANGSNTSAFGLTAYGGGGGGKGNGGEAGKDGASGGGAASKQASTDPTLAGGVAIYGEGAGDNLGHAGGSSWHRFGPGGGGGAGTEGESSSGSGSTPGAGGDGVLCPIIGADMWYGGGGAGFRSGSTWVKAGGKGGGGANDGDATPNPGMDGFGGGGNGGAPGGSGILIVAFTPGAVPDADSPDFTLTGGDEILPIWDETVHVFRQSGTLAVTGSGTVELLAVGGGGGGGTFVGDRLYGAGGGGAGGFVHLTNVAVQAGTYQITVGEGGGPGTNGEDTVAFGIRAFGGGAGGNTDPNANHPGADGGSGGGGAHRYNGTEWSEGGLAIYTSYGNIGNDGGASCHVYGSAGGGGAGAAGSSNSVDTATTSTPGTGGDGLECAITGVKLWYAGGGAGARYDNTRTVSGGRGGGGASGEPGVDGTGGGGSGGNAGGSGIVAIRYHKRVYVDEFTNATGGVKTHIPGYDIHTFTNNGTFTMPCAGKVEVLLVGGGGGGGRNGDQRDLQGGGGGGAGGVMITNLTLAAGNHSITIGEGGAVGANGGNTMAFNLTAYGGGAGARFRSNMSEQNPPGYIGNSGASGGGSTYYYYYTNNIGGGVSAAIIDGTHVPGGSAIYAAEENLGHDGGWSEHPYGAGGGGGAGAVGGSTTGSGHSLPGAGGAGVASDITGTTTYYGGGGAGYRKGTATAGGNGGGGACLADGTGTAGTDGLGGGGCGGYAGGSGVVIIRYKLPPKGTIISFR